MKTRIVHNDRNEPDSSEFSATPLIRPSTRSITDSGVIWRWQ
jgi:hypothetical protein